METDNNFKEVTAADFINEMKKIYDNNKWAYGEVHFSLLDLMSNLEAMEIYRR